MNICFINFNKNWGGVKTWTIDYGKALLGRGHGVTAIVRPENDFEKGCIDAGFDVHSFRPGMKYNPVSIFKIIRILKKNNVDIVVVNISKDVNIGAVAAWLAGVPVIHRVGLPQDYKNTSEERRLHKIVDGIIVPSNGLKEDLKAIDWLDINKVNVLYNSKKRERFLKGKGAGVVTFGVTSQLTKTKGHIFLLKAVKRLADEGLEFKLKIAGRGNQESELKKFVEDNDLAKYVEFSGFQTDVPAFLSSLDCFVLPSLTENFPNSLLEGMFSGLSCISFNVGAVKEMLAQAGVIVELEDVESLSISMKRFILDEKLRSGYADWAMIRAHEVFDIDKNVLKMEDILNKYI